MASRRPRAAGITRTFVLAAAAVAFIAAIGVGFQPATDTLPAEPQAVPSPPAKTSKEIEAWELEQRLRAKEAELVEARILLRTGRTIEGLLIKKDGRNVTIRVLGKDMQLDLADAVEYEELGKVVVTFVSLRAATSDDDTTGRLQLVSWLRDRGAYYTALDETRAILEWEPYNQTARELIRWLESQIRLQSSTTKRKTDETGKTERPVLRRKIESFPVLTTDEINLIRVYEVNFNSPPKLNITRNAVQEFIDLYGEHELMPSDPEGRRALLRRDPLTVLDLMFRVQARPLYGEVEILEDPRSMKMFRTEIHSRWFAGATGSCASASCHGGQEAGRLYLNNKRTNTDATVYTNFFIANEFLLRDGTPLINYEEPAKSPLLQMALPRERSERAHPLVSRTAGKRGWRPYFRDEKDLRFRRAVEWIKSMYSPHPEYPIEYEPPVSRSAKRFDPDTPQTER